MTQTEREKLVKEVEAEVAAARLRVDDALAGMQRSVLEAITKLAAFDTPAETEKEPG